MKDENDEGHEKDSPYSAQPLQEEKSESLGLFDVVMDKKPVRDCLRLTDSIYIFPGNKLSQSPWSNVYEGVKTSAVLPEQKLAIKLKPNLTAAFTREAKNLVKLRPHANVVTIYMADYCTEGPLKCIFIAMERCSTENLASFTANRKKENVPFDIRQTFEYSKQIVRGLQHIHSCGILHRDLKPSSILFSLDRNFVKISDFGLSKELRYGRSLTKASTMEIGTDGYRAPETYNANSISKMADIYSLGLVMHHQLSYGLHPFGLDPDQWNFNIKHDINLDLRHVRAPFFELLQGLLENMLRFQPKDRPNIEEVCDRFMKIEWFSTVMNNLIEVWNGTIKDLEGSDVLPCKLFRMPSAREVVGIDHTEWTFQINIIPSFNISLWTKVTDQEPNGYIVAFRDEVERLIKKLTGNSQIAWIDISKQGGDGKVLILLSNQNYPQLHGFFLTNPESVLHTLKNLESELFKREEHSEAIPDESHAAQTGRSEQFVASVSEKELNGQTFSASEPRQSREATQFNQELIPWWILDENIQTSIL